MPTYEYACRSCGEHVEVVQSFKDEPLTTCGICGGDLRKVFSAAGIIFKGDGYYVTDTRKQEKKAAAGDGSSKAGTDSKGDGASKTDSTESTSTGSASSEARAESA